MSGAFLAGLLVALQAIVPTSAIGSLAIPAPARFLGSIERSVSGSRSLGPDIKAASAVVVDVPALEKRFGKRPHAVRSLASTIKLLTALVVVGEREMAAIVTVEEDDIPQEGHTRLRKGDQVSVDQLLTAMLVASDNGAARALARSHDGGWKSMQRVMQRYAREAGAGTVTVADPAGLDPETRGSAVDVARLLIAAQQSAPIRSRLQLPNATLIISGPNERLERIVSTNALLGDAPPRTFSPMGGKTGSLDEAGFNLAQIVERDRQEFAIVVLGSTSHWDRFLDVRRLAAWALRFGDEYGND
jgi:D-alanyl-D-alanine carboxypeptidase